MDGTDEGRSRADTHQGDLGGVAIAHVQTKVKTSVRASDQGIISHCPTSNLLHYCVNNVNQAQNTPTPLRAWGRSIPPVIVGRGKIRRFAPKQGVTTMGLEPAKVTRLPVRDSTEATG